MPIEKFPLTDQWIGVVKRHVSNHVRAYRNDSVLIAPLIADQPGGRALCGSQLWPIQEALEYFTKMKVGVIEGDRFRVIDHSYFESTYASLPLPIEFSLDERIQKEIILMTGMYAELYDIENRLRFYLTIKLTKQSGDNWISEIPRKVKDDISNQKKLKKIHIIDSRTEDLEFTDFLDLKKIINDKQTLFKDLIAKDIIEKLDYLNEVRTLVAHNNILVPDEVEKTRFVIHGIRKIISNN